MIEEIEFAFEQLTIAYCQSLFRSRTSALKERKKSAERGRKVSITFFLKLRPLILIYGSLGVIKKGCRL